MNPEPSLLEVVQALLERTYRMRSRLPEIGRFVIGDLGFRVLYAGRTIVPSVDSAAGAGAKTLVHESNGHVRACIYYPDELIRTLETHPPQNGLDDRNVDEFATLVEELDHLLVLAERARDGRPTTLFELELHANVSKYLVLSRFLSKEGRPLPAKLRVWLRYHLFHKGTPSDGDPAVSDRYRDASRWALRLLDAAARQSASRRVEALRSFHAAGVPGKLELIRSLSS